MSGEIDWLGGGGEVATVATVPALVAAPPPPTRRRAAPKGAIPFPDAWLLFRVADDGRAEDVRAVAGSHLNRLQAGEARDWSHDIHLAAFGPEDQPVRDMEARDAWQGFLRAWPVDPQHLAEAMRQVSQVEGLEWLHGMAAIYEDARK